jgi:hypothetical protein
MVLRFIGFLLLAGLATSGCTGPAALRTPVSITSTNYAGWANSYVLRSASAEVVVAPAVGRVMRFGFAGEDSVLWENPVLLGKPLSKNPWSTPGSFGGDKTWPAPQSGWNWPPPTAFDAAPCEATIVGDSLILTTPVDPNFGIRATRRITLSPFEPSLEITTTYEKVQGAPVQLSVWVISQLRDPVGVYLRIPKNSQYPQGYNLQGEAPGNQLQVQGDLLKMTRHPSKSFKIGSDATALLWAGKDTMCLIEVSRQPGATYPDNGSTVEIYTNPNPADYVELETLGPLKLLKTGESMSNVNRYTLKRRRRADPDADAQPIL